MPIQFTDFSSKPLLDSPAKTIFEDVLKGYEMSQKPGQLKQESQKRELVNQLKTLEVEHKPKEYALGDQEKSLANALKAKANSHYEENYQMGKQLKQAQINKANKPEALKGALAAAFQLRSNLNPDDPNYQKDTNAINNFGPLLYDFAIEYGTKKFKKIKK